MASISKYNEARERWTWRRQVMDDERTKILSSLQVQGNGECSYFALVTTLEANLKVKLKIDTSLSIPHLKILGEHSRNVLPTEAGKAGKITRLLMMIQHVGICEEGQYGNVLEGTLEETSARRYKIDKFYHYKMDKSDHIEYALYQLRAGGPLVAVIRISENYDECYNTGVIYRFDPDRVVVNDDIPQTHAVCVVSFAVEGKVPCLECQDSQGPQFGSDGFLKVDITSVAELYSIKIKRVQ